MMRGTHGVIASGYSAISIPSDYIAYYIGGGSITGSTLTDESANSYDMTLGAGAVANGAYIDFSGASSGYAESTSIPALTSDCAISFWMIPDAAPSGAFEYPFQQRQCVGFIHDHSASSIRGAGLRQKTGGTFDITSPKGEVTDTTNPTHIIVMVDGATMYYYKDGTEVGSVSIGTALAESNKFNIGCGQTGNGTTRTSFFAGRIKSFRVYDRSLSTDEIAALSAEH